MAEIENCKSTCTANDLLCVEQCDKICAKLDSDESSFKIFSIGTAYKGEDYGWSPKSYIYEMPSEDFSLLSIAQDKHLEEVGYVFIDDKFYLLGGYQNYNTIATIENGEYRILPERLPMSFWTYTGAIVKINNKGLNRNYETNELLNSIDVLF